MKVKLLTDTTVNNEPVEAGAILDLPPSTAQLLVRTGKAEPLEGVVRIRGQADP